MRFPDQIRPIVAVGLVLALTACDSRQRGAADTEQVVSEQPEPVPGGTRSAADTGRPGDRPQAAPTPPDSEVLAPERARTQVSPTPPDSEVLAPERARPAPRHWMLIEFTRVVEEPDLRWLDENGFRVDTVMAGNMVRGWLEVPEGGEVIGRDPRIAKIHAQMR